MKINTKAAALGFCYMSMGLAPVYADDTDIFLGSAATATTKPNVLFILDNSGSMSNATSSTDSTSRMATMKKSMNRILTDVSGINAGLMRFNDPGGSILYPVSDIDSKVTQDWKLDIGVTDGGDDAAQNLSNGGTVTLGNQILHLGALTETLTLALSDKDQDAEEESNNNDFVRLDGTIMDMNQNQTNAFRFNGVGLDFDSSIYGATLELTALYNNNNVTDFNVELYAEKIANSPALVSSSSNITNRSLTTAFTNWAPGAWIADTAYTSPDISPSIREVVNDISATWVNGNSLTVIQKHDGANNLRQAYTFDRDSAKAANLTIEYQKPATAYDQQRIGLRFQDVGIPRGAKITRAYIQMVPVFNSPNDGGLDLEIIAENTGDAGAFVATSGDLTSLTPLTTVVNWNTSNWVADQSIKTPNIKDQLQLITDSSSWCGGNSVAFYIQPKSKTDYRSRAIYGFEAGQSRQPRLIVEYDPTTVPTNTCHAVTVAINTTSNGDAKENTSGGWVNTSKTTLSMSSSEINGLRFADLPLKQGAKILDARIEYTAATNATNNQILSYTIQNSVFPDVFSNTYKRKKKKVRNLNDITNRTYNSKTVNWSTSSSQPLTDWTQGSKYRTPNLNNLVQDIVDLGSWDPNSNAIVIKQTASQVGSREALTADSTLSTQSPRLLIKVDKGDIQGGSNNLTVREHLKSLVNDLQPQTYTPIVDSLYEAARYYRGDNVFWGRARNHEPNLTDGNYYYSASSNNARNRRISSMSSIQPLSGTLSQPLGCTNADLGSSNCENEVILGTPKYISPITEDCQANYIVLLTDGLANQNHSKKLIQNYVPVASCSNTKNSEACSEELVEWMAKNDMASASTGNDISGINTVKTFTIAFSLNDTKAKNYLKNLASKSIELDANGKPISTTPHYYEAGSEDALTQAFTQILSGILDNNTTFVVPGTTVSQFNRLSHFEDIYFSVFKPGVNPRWQGNLKKYKILQDSTSANFGRIVDQNDSLAVDPTTGFFEKTAISFWTDPSTPDGNSVTLGGAVEVMQNTIPASRALYTYHSNSASIDLTDASNKLDETNPDITSAMLGVPAATAAERKVLLDWARGTNPDGSIRNEIGDPLHSAPVAITYGDLANLGQPIPPNPSASDMRFIIYFGTNDGFLHAIEGRTGEEIFSFIPEDLLPNLNTLMENRAGVKHPYGIDGDITRWVYDKNKDGIINPSDGDHVYIYFGQRRGGKNYYALDVTVPEKPQLMWQIDGGLGNFADLGQSWSQPVKAKVSIDVSGSLVQKDVLIFGGGYDANQDTATSRQVDNEGNAIFMVEAGYSSTQTPAVVWSAGNGVGHDLNLTNMNYSIPGLVKVGDTNGDGLVDVMFGADLGGQVWRFDIANGQPANKLVTGGVIAELADDTIPNSRRFYAGIDASTLAFKGSRYISLTLGSGWRANPLDKSVDDRFYMIKQTIAKPATYTKLTENDLYDATLNLIASTNTSTAAQAQQDLDNASGWFIKMTGAGEKILSGSVTANAQILFTSYQPDVQTNLCKPSPGQGWLYGVNAENATPFIKDDSGNLTRRTDLQGANIPPTPTLIVLPDGSTRTLVGPEEEGELIEGDPIHKTYWFDE